MDKMKDLSYKTKVKVVINNEHVVYGEVVGVATLSQPVIGALHIIKCTDGFIPNEDYPYDTYTVPLSMIEVVEQ